MYTNCLSSSLIGYSVGQVTNFENINNLITWQVEPFIDKGLKKFFNFIKGQIFQWLKQAAFLAVRFTNQPEGFLCLAKSNVKHP